MKRSSVPVLEPIPRAMHAALPLLSVALVACGASVVAARRVSTPGWVGDPWLGMMPPCASVDPSCIELVSDDERRFVDHEGTAWRLVRSVAPEGIDVWRQREGTVPFVEARRVVGVIDGSHRVRACEGEGAHETEWTDADHDGAPESVREETRDAGVRISTSDTDGDGDCDHASRTTELDPGTRVERDADCDGVFETSETSETSVRDSSGC